MFTQAYVLSWRKKKKNDFFKSIGKAVTVTDQGATLEAKPAWIASLQ